MSSERHVPTGLTLPDAIRGYKARRRGYTRDAVLTAFYQCPRIKRVVKHAVRKYGADRHLEDVEDYVFTLFIKKYLKIPDPEKIYNVVHVAAGHRARRLVSGEADQNEVSIEEEMERFEGREYVSFMADPNDFVEDAHDKIAMERAFEEFARRIASPAVDTPAPDGLNTPLRSIAFEVMDQDVLVKSGSTKAPARASKGKSAPKSTTRTQPPLNGAANKKLRTPCADGLRLRDIRLEYGYSLDSFAQTLGLQKGTLSSYIYGAVQSVPKMVMDLAEEIASQDRTQATLDRVARLTGRSMADVAEGWLTRFEALGLDRATAMKSLQAAIGVNRSTIWRWAKQDLEPNWTKVDAHESAVEAYIRRLKVEMRQSNGR